MDNNSKPKWESSRGQFSQLHRQTLREPQWAPSSPSPDARRPNDKEHTRGAMIRQQFDPGVSRATPDKLCRRCRKIDFKKYIYRKMPPLPIGRWYELSENCPFCRLIEECFHRHARERFPRGACIQLENCESLDSCIFYSLYDGSRSKSYSTYWDLRETEKEARHAFRFSLSVDQDKIGTIQYFADNDPRRDQFLFGRLISQRYANRELIRSWLQRCKQIHGRSCDELGGVARFLPQIRVIDVQQRVVVIAPRNCRYVALSYVWGDRNFVTSKREDVEFDERENEVIYLPDTLPQTIEDAIVVTSVLGERFLWVDALCIVQDDRNEKHSQILRMDAIYNSATITIVAGSGDNADHGLAGISRARRVAQVTESFKGFRFGLPLPDYNSTEGSSSIPWNTRAWTFQERVLSRRLLFFTDHQVYFQCSNMVWSEDTVMETQRCSASTNKKWRPLRWAPDRVIGEPKSSQESVNISNYKAVISEFTQRNLSRREDGVHAVEGILRTMVRHIGPSHCGLPEKIFPAAIMWEPMTGIQTRRCTATEAPFPTWSWARWDLPLGCTWTTSADLHNADLVHAAFLLTPSGSTRLNAPTRRYLRLHNRVKYPRLSPEGRRLLQTVGIMLCIKTSAGTGLWIGPRISADTSDIKTGEFSRCKLLYKSTACVGEITVPAEYEETGMGQKELLAICIAKGYSGTPVASQYVGTKIVNTTTKIVVDGVTQYVSSQKAVDLVPSEYKVYSVLLVEWIAGIAHRVGVGSVVSTVWNKIAMRKQWVILG